MSAVDFSKLNKLTAKSFNEQKALIKKVMQGRVIKCPTCQQNLKLVLPEENKKAYVNCPKGCTDIELDMN
ncbi:hypothetical protein [Thalassotalea sp. ND16A]|uniref:hypothetical protein n=1 Tax=Thalassotalea sp. ND16A TaxID=1535422 RepID=UPI00051A2D23|nr:hypothetical protein [Thalassotalea sp. ND16A]KGK00638.1 hypothetical protein ND16A_3398 [Thalassotalea sp. ND16A]